MILFISRNFLFLDDLLTEKMSMMENKKRDREGML